MNLIIFDFEVFKYDTLLGAKILDDSSSKLFQFWNLDEIKKFYLSHENDIWIGHNNYGYDNIILSAIMKNKNPKKTNDEIIMLNHRFHYTVPKYSYDIMAASVKPFSLKYSELFFGNAIHMSEIDFNIDRVLTKEEKKLVEKYNEDDINQTEFNFYKMFTPFKFRLDLIKEFNLSLTHIDSTESQIGALVLNAKHDDNLENAIIKPRLYDNLILENKELKDFYLNEKFRTDEKLKILVGNAEITIGSGGIHSAIKQYYTKKALYFDVSGYYNLIMINNDLLPRTLDKNAKDKYIYMYHEQLKLKKTNPARRAFFKTVLLCVFGSMLNKYTDFYDPWKGSLVTITGQLYIVDLCEKLKDLCIFVQTNTDGLIVEPKNWNDEEKIIKIVKEWESRTNFVIKKEYIYEVYQRDVNCYFYLDENNKVVFKGEAVKNYELSNYTYEIGSLFACKEPPIIAQGIINYCLFNKLPEDFVEENKKDLRLFQYISKKNTFDYLEYEFIKDGNKTTQKVSDICRSFALKQNEGFGMIYKHKLDKKLNKDKISKVSNLPNSVFIYNKSLFTNDTKMVYNYIDYDYYVYRIYERIAEFIKIS